VPTQSFRGDPYRVLDVPEDATDAAIKRRWRELASEHHPDRAAGDPTEAARLTARMARINAAYDVVRDPERRARHDVANGRRRRGDSSGTNGAGNGTRDGGSNGSGAGTDQGRSGPPRPRPERPVTGRFDTTDLFYTRNTTTSAGRTSLRGHPPRSADHGYGEPLRASEPNGPVKRRTARPPAVEMPTLAVARATPLEFGKFRGHTLGEVEAFEPTYIDWIAQTITRDRDLVIRARVIQAALDEAGVERRVRPTPPPPGSQTDEGASASR
jgi:curved DNA-binding protein CbpA